MYLPGTVTLNDAGVNRATDGRSNLEDPARFESDCQLQYDEETYEYSFVLSNGEKSLEYEGIDYSDLSDMIVAVEIIDHKDSDRTTLFEEDDDE